MSTPAHMPRRAERPRFSSEDEMVESFTALLEGGQTPWGDLQFTREWDYRTGKTDVLARAVDGGLIAFEAKLTDWRKAAHQAYKNTVFVGNAYVVMPAAKAQAVAKNQSVFQSYGVGLCSFDGNHIAILIDARPAQPLIPWLQVSAQEFFDRGACGYDYELGAGRSGGLQRTARHAAA